MEYVVEKCLSALEALRDALYKYSTTTTTTSVFSWFKDYLTNRQQFVSVSNVEWKKIVC